MATIGKVAAIFTASTAGLKSAVADAGRSFKQLGGDSSALSSAFAKLRTVSGQGLALVGPAAEQAGRKLAVFEGLAAKLQESLAAGRISADAFAAKMEAIRVASDAASASLSRGAEITQQYETAEQLHARTTQELVKLLGEGALAEDTFARAIADADKKLADANGTTAAAAAAVRAEAQALAASEQAIADVRREGEAVTKKYATAEEVHASEVSDLTRLLDAGVISQSTFARAIAQADATLANANGTTAAAAQAAKDLADAQRAASEALAETMRRGKQVTDEVATAEEQHASKVSELQALLQAGAISQETFSRATAAAESALADANGTTEAAAQAARDAAAAEMAFAEAQGKAMDEFTATMRRGASVADEVATAEERHEARVRELRGLLAAGAISQTTFNRAVDQADEELRQASTASNKFQKAVSSTDDALRKINSKLTALVGINAAQLFGSIASAAADAARSAFSFAASEAEAIDRTGKLAERLGMTYGEFAGLAHAAALADVDMEAVGRAATKADVALVRAANGSAQAQAAFAGIGLSVDQLQSMSPAERFKAISQAIASLPTEAERAAAAVALFGRQGAELMPMFNGGADAIAQATAEADRFGLALTNEQRSSVEAMNDSFKNAYESIRGVVDQVVAYLSPALKAVTDTFTNLIGGIGGANIGQFIGDGILRGAEFFATIADGFLAQVPVVWQYVASVAEYWSGVLDFAGRVANLLYGAFKVFEVVGNVIGGLFSDIVAGLYRAAANIAEVIPGFGEFAKGLDKSADSWAAQGDQFASSMNENANEAGRAFSAAFGESTQQAAAAVPGPIVTGLRQAIAQAQADAAAVNEPKPQTVGPKKAGEERLFTGTSSEALKGVDSRSKEGVAEMFRLMRGTGGDIQERQLGVLEQIHEDLSEGDAENIFEIMGA
jgi:hypothetical protein